MVLAGDAHVYRRSMLSVLSGGVQYRVPYIQIPPAASTPPPSARARFLRAAVKPDGSLARATAAFSG